MSVRRWLALAVAVSAAVALCCVGGVGAFVQLSGGPGAFASTCGSGTPVDDTGPLPTINGLGTDQIRNAAIIIATGQQMRVPAKGWVIALATALQESTLRNLGHLGERNDHDSLGLFQQRPSQGWGSPEQLMDPRYAARKFYEALQQVTGWQTMALTDAAQRVQRSAYPHAYANDESLALQIANALTGREPDLGTPLACVDAAGISPPGWTTPVKAAIVSEFRTPKRRNHHGVDLGAPYEAEIHAAATGVVITAICDPATIKDMGTCDRDGSPKVRGCGWYVNILHAENVITRYCHMIRRPAVAEGQHVVVGQLIGHVGNSGRSSGPHLHYEVHLGGDRTSAGAIDPVGWMRSKGAPLD